MTYREVHEVTSVVEMYEHKSVQHPRKTRGLLYTTNRVRYSLKRPDHLHVGLAILELIMSADELTSTVETFASEARTAGRTLLEYPIPLDAKLRSDIRFFFAGDFRWRAPSAESADAILIPVIGAEALSSRNADSSTACVGGRRLERRRAFSMRSGPMFERRRETFRAAAERGVGGGRSAGLLFTLRRSAVGALEGKGGRCTPPPTPLLLQVLLLLLVDGASSANEFRLRSESARLSVVVVLSPFSSSSLSLPSVDAPRDLKKLGSSRLPRRVRVAPP